MMDSETQTWPIRGFDFTVDTAGTPSHPPVLLLHGFPQNRRMWRDQLNALAAAGFYAIAPDQRGYSSGARPRELEAYATGHLTADALALMDSLGTARFHLVGHDWGGQLAWLIAAGYPDRVATLTMLSRPHPAAFSRAMAEDPEQAGRSRHHKTFRQSDAVERLAQDNFKLLRSALERDGIAPANADLYLRPLAEDGALQAAVNWYRASVIASAIAPVSVPTLYIWGNADGSVGRRAAELTADFVRGPYQFVEIDGGGHFVVDQFPERIARLLVAHVQSVAL